MRAYLSLFGARFRLLLQYRMAAWAGVATQVFWGGIRMMIFAAFYEQAPDSLTLTYPQTVAYVWLGQAFLALIPFRVDGELEGLIRSGNVAYELLRPVDLYARWFVRTAANRAAPTLLRCVPVLVFAAAMGFLPWPGFAGLAGFAALLLTGLMVSSGVAMLLNVAMIHTISGRGLNAVIVSGMFLLSGMIVPLPMFPDWAQPILRALPMRTIIDVPFRVFTGHLPASAIPAALAQGLAWTAGLVVIGRAAMRLSLRRLVVQGG